MSSFRALIHHRLQSHGYATYEDYLASDAWRKKRWAYKREFGWDCKRCGAPADCLHHQTYKRVCEEELSDLASLCSPCHKIIHSYSNSNLWVSKRNPNKKSKPKPPAISPTADAALNKKITEATRYAGCPMTVVEIARQTKENVFMVKSRIDDLERQRILIRCEGGWMLRSSVRQRRPDPWKKLHT